MLTWLRGVLVVAVALTGPAYGESVELPGRTMVGGMVRDDGEALLVMRRSQSARDGSFLVRLDGGGIRTVELPGRRVKTTKPLVGGRLALWNFRAHPGGGDHGSLSHEIIELDGKDKVRSLWEWDSRRDSEEGYGMHPPFVYVSGDGEAWAMHAGASGTAFTFGRTASSRTTRFDSASVTDDEADIDGWLDEPFVTFLESDGPVVLVPRGDGGYILRFADGRGSPHVVPFLRGDGVTEVEFRWQWAERVLWALHRVAGRPIISRIWVWRPGRRRPSGFSRGRSRRRRCRTMNGALFGLSVAALVTASSTSGGTRGLASRNGACLTGVRSGRSPGSRKAEARRSSSARTAGTRSSWRNAESGARTRRWWSGTTQNAWS